MVATELRKAAVLLMSMPEDLAGNLLSKLTPKQVEAVSIEIAKIAAIGGEEQEATILEFANANPGSASNSTGGLDLAKNLVEKALGKNASGTIENVRQQIESLPFAFLQKVDATNLLTFIMDEHPQTIALILAHLHASNAAQLATQLPEDLRVDVLTRMANLDEISPEVISQISTLIGQRLTTLGRGSREQRGGIRGELPLAEPGQHFARDVADLAIVVALPGTRDDAIRFFEAEPANLGDLQPGHPGEETERDRRQDEQDQRRRWRLGSAASGGRHGGATLPGTRENPHRAGLPRQAQP